MQFKFFSIVALAATAIADSALVNKLGSNFDQIEREVLRLNNTVANWDGNMFTVMPMLVQCGNVVRFINAGTKVAKTADGTASLEEAQTIVDKTQKLADHVGGVIEVVIRAKSKFVNLNPIFSPIVYAAIKHIQTSAMGYSDTLMKAAPLDKFKMQEKANDITKQYNVHFENGMAAYQ